ncbi:MAG: response regulator [Isosphaeraceae bacterium]|nr:response regulator [Isosphaeraceae bacterium]
MPEKPRILVIERDPLSDHAAGRRLAEIYEVVAARSMTRAMVMLRDGDFAGVYVDGTLLPTVHWAGVLIQADEILATISDGVAVVDDQQRIIWLNPEFELLVDPSVAALGSTFFRALGSPEILGPDARPFETAAATGKPAVTELRVDANRYLRVTVTPVFERGETAKTISHMIALTRDITNETLQQQKINAIHVAGEELADLTVEELAEMSVEERTELLKHNIGRHMRELLCFDYVEIRLLDRATGRLIPLLNEGMTPIAAARELFADRQGNGVTGYVAATGQSYLCPDTAGDPLYLEGAAGARSSLTVPLMFHAHVIGTLNVENSQPNAFDERDRMFLEIYGRDVAVALNTLELLQAEKQSTASASVEAISREVALPLDDILNDATIVLDRYAGHDEDIIHRLRHLLYQAREVRSSIQRVGSTIAPPARREAGRSVARLQGVDLLVVDSEESTRRSAHQLLGRQGAVVETARDAAEAIALARVTRYSAALVDIRLPDMNGFDAYRRLRDVQPGLPVILMTGFGYDPTHSIVKARQEGLQSVLYKPFRVDRLLEAVEQAIRPSTDPGTSPPEAGRESAPAAPID